jgi:hypothetical protein
MLGGRDDCVAEISVRRWEVYPSVRSRIDREIAGTEREPIAARDARARLDLFAMLERR